MRRVRIIRLEQTEAGLIGVLLINGVVEGFTMQPDSADSSFSIPAGSYICKRFHGYKYKDTFEVVVPGHTALLFHAGNIEDETDGCILLGERVGWLYGKRAVLSSGVSFEEFMWALKDEQEFNLFIEDHLEKETSGG
jgi:hypothetical protein